MKSALLEKIALAVALLLLISVFSACSPKINFTTSAVVPAAEGRVKVKRDKNSNYLVNITITHLAGPDRLSPPKAAYVVWIETGNGIKNVGRISSSSGFLSKTLKASLQTVTSFKPTKVFITAEAEGDIMHPGVPVVLTTENF